jgi:hypothetical protein
MPRWLAVLWEAATGAHVDAAIERGIMLAYRKGWQDALRTTARREAP